MRRGSAAALRVGEVSLTADGLRVYLPQSKTDQEGAGAVVVLPYGQSVTTCAPCAWTRWSALLRAADAGEDLLPLVVRTPPVADWDRTGLHWCRGDAFAGLRPESPVFRPLRASGAIGDSALSADALYRAIVVRAEAAGLDPMRYGFHSLRAGFVTQARRNGASRRQVRLQTLHRSDRMIDVYDREFNPLAGGNAVTSIGL